MQYSFSAVPLSTEHVEECADDPITCQANPGDYPQVHEQDILLSEFRLNLEFDLTERLAASLLIPFRVVRTTIAYRRPTGDTFTPVENLHHRNETVAGVADPWVLSRFSSSRGKWGYDLRAGLSLPLGRTEEDPFAAADRGKSHQHIQLGSGTANPVLGFGARRPVGKAMLDAWGIAYLVLYANSKGYEAGNRYGGGLGLSFRGGDSRPWSARGGLDVQEEKAERWSGVVHESDGNQGRRDLFVEGSASWKISEEWFLNGTLKAPVYSRVVGGELDYPAILEFGFSRSLGLHEHAEGGENHGQEAGSVPSGSATRLAEETGPAKVGGRPGRDLEVAVAEGEDGPLVPVPGKVTVFDFWASWCLPCRDLDRRLEALLDLHPNLAVRTVNVVDWDSPVARHYLADVSALPYVRVHGPDGRLLFSRSGSPRGIARAVGRAVSPP